MATYKVKYGDTLSGIARANNTTLADLLKANPNITDPNRIQAGASLNLTSATPVSTPTPQPTTKPTIAEKASLIPDAPKEDPAMTAYYDEQKKAMQTPIDEKATREQIRQRYNSQFESLRLAAAQKIADERKLGEGRLGSARATQARSGTLGSNFAGAENDQIDRDTQDIVNLTNAEVEAKIALLMGDVEKDYSAQIAAQKDAKKKGADEYIKYLETRDSQKATRASSLAKMFAAQGIDPNTLSKEDIAKLEATYGVDLGSFKNMITEEKNKINKDKFFELSDGQAKYEYDPITGQAKLIAENTKNFAPKSGSGSGSGGSSSGYGVDANGNKVQISSRAQVYVDAVNNGANLDDILKGTSRETQALRGEVIAGLNLQGGQSKKAIDVVTEGKTIVDDLITSGGYKALGGYSTVLGGQFSTGYGDAKAKANQLSAILAKDNLGLLKGAMSDKDLAFIQSMSTGFDGEGVQSEAYIKSRLEQIQTKLANRIAASGFGGGNTNTNTQNTPVNNAPQDIQVSVRSTDGRVISIPQSKLAEALKAGYTQVK
jgi:hypothetical protein